MNLVRLSLSINRTEQGGLRAVFGGTGLDPDHLTAVTKAVAAELLTAIASSSRADESRDVRKPDTQRCPA